MKNRIRKMFYMVGIAAVSGLLGTALLGREQKRTYIGPDDPGYSDTKDSESAIRDESRINEGDGIKRIEMERMRELEEGDPAFMERAGSKVIERDKGGFEEPERMQEKQEIQGVSSLQKTYPQDTVRIISYDRVPLGEGYMAPGDEGAQKTHPQNIVETTSYERMPLGEGYMVPGDE